MLKIKSLSRLAISIVICLFAGFFGSIFTTQAIPNWYAGLVKPVFNPPNWLFGPVWTLLYIMMGISFYLIWIKDTEFKKSKKATYAFGIQLALNAIWSLLFFGLKSPLYGLVCIIALWIAILFTIKYFYKIEKKAAYLLIPYITWVSFAAILNFAIFYLNM